MKLTLIFMFFLFYASMSDAFEDDKYKLELDEVKGFDGNLF